MVSNILKTPSPVLALTTKDIVEIAGEIMKGNFKSFLDLGIFDYYEAIALWYDHITNEIN